MGLRVVTRTAAAVAAVATALSAACSTAEVRQRRAKGAPSASRPVGSCLYGTARVRLQEHRQPPTARWPAWSWKRAIGTPPLSVVLRRILPLAAVLRPSPPAPAPAPAPDPASAPAPSQAAAPSRWTFATPARERYLYAPARTANLQSLWPHPCGYPSTEDPGAGLPRVPCTPFLLFASTTD